MSVLVSPPAKSPRFERDEDNLVKGLVYRYKEDGSIDWLAMVPRKYLYVVKEKEAKVVAAQGKPLDQCDLMLVNPRWLRIRLAGLLQLAFWRGYSSLTYPTFISTDTKASAVCEMTFIGDPDSSGYPFVCSGAGSACRLTMDRDFMGHLEAFAENRALARCIKRGLQIVVLCEDEVEGKDRVADDEQPDAAAVETGSEPSGFKPFHVLKDLCLNRAKPIAFAKVKETAIGYAAELESTPADWVDWESIPPLDAWAIHAKVEKADAAAKGKKTP